MLVYKIIKKRAEKEKFSKLMNERTEYPSPHKKQRQKQEKEKKRQRGDLNVYSTIPHSY
jgi:hypothetical protein